MTYYINNLILMIFCHFISDFYLQSKSNSLIKKKEWWEKRHKKQKVHEYNYIFGLFIHSFVWGVSILLPFFFETGEFYYSILLINILIHAYIDNLKSNKKTISSSRDQMYHMIQIFVTWVVMSIVY